MVGVMLKRTYKNDRLPIRSPIEVLSDRELEILEMIGKGLTSEGIARCVQRSVKTIEAHRSNIKKKLNLLKNLDLIRFAMEWTREIESIRN